jgi:hypothetical protein
MEQARSFNHHNHHNRGGGDARSAADGSETNMYGSRSAGRASSVASLSSGLAQQAKTIVNSMKDFNCNTANERNGSVGRAEAVPIAVSRLTRGRLREISPPDRFGITQNRHSVLTYSATQHEHSQQ